MTEFFSQKGRSRFQEKGTACAKAHNCERHWYVGVINLRLLREVRRQNIKLRIRL